ncbi:MAG: DUF3501 family protein [Magnetospirillum sp.]|jgi:hypothetical protein|nr:DUF3501 family protein [Magnetospirillum sp.]
MALAVKREISRADILPIEAYALERKALRESVVAAKRLRRVSVGPDATFYFENYQTMWHQVHEMLFIEKGGEAQIADELAAFNPLIPQGAELVATMMIEIDDAVRRAATLNKLGHIERHIAFEVGGKRIAAAGETDVERTKDDGKTSSVHFLRFAFDTASIAAFCKPGARVLLGIDHPNYGHMAVLGEDVRAALAEDFSA